MRKRTGRVMGFAAVPNETVDDAAHLDLTALGLLTILLRHKDGWDVTLADIGASYGHGEDALARAMGMLQVARYVVKVRIMSTDGNRWSTEIVVFDHPASDEEIEKLLADIRREPGVRQVQIIPPTKTALAHAEKRRQRLAPDSGISRSRGDLRKHGKTAGRPDSGVSRESESPRVIKKTRGKKTKEDSSPLPPPTDAQASQPCQGQEEEAQTQTQDQAPAHEPYGSGEREAAAALVADLPRLAATATGRPIRPLRSAETTRLVDLAAAALARGWAVDQLRAELAADLAGARHLVAVWHHRLTTLGPPPIPAAAPASDEPRCHEYPWRLEDPVTGRDLGACPKCHPSARLRQQQALPPPPFPPLASGVA